MAKHTNTKATKASTTQALAGLAPVTQPKGHISPLAGSTLVATTAAAKLRPTSLRAQTVQLANGQTYDQAIANLTSMAPKAGARAAKGGGIWFAQDMVRTMVRLGYLAATPA